MSERLVLAIDQGTSATKVVVFEESGAKRAQGTAQLSSSYPRPGFVEQSPREIMETVRVATGRCLGALKESGGDPADIFACGISNQRETFLLWDSHGIPLVPAVVWQCRRSREICDRLRAEGLEPDLRALTGLVLDPYFSGTKVMWLVEKDDSIQSAVRRGGVHFGTVDTWILFVLTHGAVYATDHTNASRTLLFNVNTLAWEPSIIRRFGLEGLLLPSTHPSSFPFAETDLEGLLPRRVPLAAMIGDSHAAAFGEACVTPGTAKVTMGTGSSIMLNVGTGRIDSKAGMVSTVCWSLPDRLAYALEGIIVSCGATIQWLKEKLGLFASSADTEGMATAVPDNGGVCLVPAFSGMGAPWWRMDAKAALCGLTFATTKNHVVRAALESIPFQIADVLEVMQKESNAALTELKADGGITANRFVMQLLADVLGTPVVNRGLEEVSALGAALLAGLGSGLYGGVESIPWRAFQERRFSPGSGAAVAREAHAEWKKKVARAL